MRLANSAAVSPSTGRRSMLPCSLSPTGSASPGGPRFCSLHSVPEHWSRCQRGAGSGRSGTWCSTVRMMCADSVWLTGRRGAFTTSRTRSAGAAGFARTCRTASTQPRARPPIQRQASPPGCSATSSWPSPGWPDYPLVRIPLRCTVRGVTLDIATATAAELTSAIRDRQLSSRELLEAQLARAEEVNPALNAIVAWDIERAQAAASAADDTIARGEVVGPLHGLPMTVKDVWETEGLVTTSGATELAKHIPAADALGVARLKRAGAIIFGKTNTPEYAGDWQTYNEVYGRTNNPWDVSRTAGGSSGGAAAAVAAGLTPLEFGSDIGGSIRVPSHCNGVYGLKPSWGVVPVRGHIPGPPGSLLTPDVGVAGPMARSVADLRTALGVLAGPLPEDAPGWKLDLDPGPGLTDVAGLRVAIAFDDGADMVQLARAVRAQLG